jgi:plastocyanin
VQAPPAPTEATPGSVTLSTQDARVGAKLASAEGSSVQIWGDPHVTVVIDGVEEQFDIGYGPGSITLSSGNVVSWNTYEAGHEHQHLLSTMSVDSLGTSLDHTVTTFDDKPDDAGVATALSDADVRELAAQLELYKGDWTQPLTRATPDDAKAA